MRLFKLKGPCFMYMHIYIYIKQGYIFISVETQQSSYNILFINKLFHAFMQLSVWIVWEYFIYVSIVESNYGAGTLQFKKRIIYTYFACLFKVLYLINVKRAGPNLLWDITWPQGRFMDDQNFKNFHPTKFDFH